MSYSARGMRIIASHTGLRGVAALLVVLYHLQFGAVSYLPIETASALPRRGYLAVDLFFILSGFIISYVHRADRDWPMTMREGRTFLQARLARLYPPLLLALAATLLLAAAHAMMADALGRPDPVDWRFASLRVLAAQAVLLNAWIPGPIGWNVPTWSVSAEMGAYLLFPLAVAGLARHRWWTGSAMAALSLAFYLLILYRGGSLDRIGPPLAPARCLAGFWLGILLFLSRHRWAALPLPWLSAVQALSLAGTFYVLTRPVADPIAIPVFVTLVGATWTDRGWLARILGTAPAQRLGALSYSIYLMHVPVLDAANDPWIWVTVHAGIPPHASRLLWIAIAFTLVIATAALTYRYVERPGRQWLARRLIGHRLPPIAEAPAAP